MNSRCSRGMVHTLALLALAAGASAQGSPQLTLSAAAGIGTVVQLQLSHAPSAGYPFMAALSTATSPGIPVGPSQVVPLAWDSLFETSLVAPGLLGLSTNQGLLNAQGAASIWWNVPNVPSLVGFSIYSAYVTLNPATFAVAGISPALQITFQLPPPPPPPPPPVTPVLDPHQDLPGVVITILQLTGGTGPSGKFLPGNTMTVRFRITKKDGTALSVLDMNSLRIMIAGPTFNYQRVINQVSTVRDVAVAQPDGTWLYTFTTPIPATYGAPLNDTTSFGPLDGEMTGQPLVSGTYTVGMEGYKNYLIEGANVRDADNATFDFLIGSANFIVPREVVKMENCNNCHSSLRVHGGGRKEVGYCLLCHTSGSEDRNVATAAGGTPGVSIDFRVMIHKIHNGKNLPSVLGVATDPSGTRNYAATPKPYQVVGNSNSIHDYSEIGFPVWPNLNIAMPRDQGYTALTATQKALEDTMRMGATACDKCHGDPDGAGPVAAPLQAANIHQKQSRRACGSCHDDVDFTHPYDANGQQMPAVFDDDSCLVCHPASGSPLSPVDGHLHPLNNPAVNPGLNVNLLAVAEAGIHNANGRIDPGEKIAVSFTLTDDLGNPVAPSAAGSSLSLVIAGPTFNRQVVLYHSLATAALGAGPTYNVILPELVFYEYLGTSTAAIETFGAARTAVWNVSGAAPTLQVRTATGFATALATAATAFQNFIDVADASGLLRNDYVVIDDGVPGAREYARIQTIQGNRLWFGAAGTTAYKPALALSHAAGATVAKVTLVNKTLGTDYTLNTANGTIQEVTEFGAGNQVILTYNTDFVLPSVYGVAINETPDLGDAAGKWNGKPIESGTYTVGLWGARTINLVLLGETNSYRGTSPPATLDFLVGSATTIQPGAIVSSAANCNACHDDMYFHGGGRRGYDTCILCHGTAGAEDRTQYVAPNAPPTTGVMVDFREMLHKIHMGKELANAATYTVNGFGSTAYPNNFTAHSYAEVGFPAMPDGVKECRKCHGPTSTAWQVPAERDHSTNQAVPVLEWRVACSSCHDSALAQTHFLSNTTAGGAEACALCHGQGQTWEMSFVHKVR